MKVQLAGFESESVVDGPGIRLVVFFQGCPHRCEGCHNPNTFDPLAGEIYDIEDIKGEITAARGITGVTFSGGEPFLQLEALAELVRFVKTRGLHVVIYSGYTYEELMTSASKETVGEILQDTDILIDGKYLKAQRDLSIAFRGSRNQRIVDVPATRQRGQVVTLEI